MASRTLLLPRKLKEMLETPPLTFGVGQVLFDPARGVDEVDGVVVVLLHAGGDGEDVGIEDDVFGREADLVDEDAVGALADADAVFEGGGLALLVEGHDDDGGAVFEHRARHARGTSPRLL